MKFLAAALACVSTSAYAAVDFGKLAGNLKFPLNFDINGKKEATKTNAYDSKEGETKRKDYNGCNDDPCRNGGLCVETGDRWSDYYCSCPFPWYGQFCELTVLRDECDPNPCLNEGVCQNGVLSAICSCPFPFYGTICELEELPPDFCDPNPCQNGGVCQNGAFSAICSCPLPFYGTNCKLEEIPPEFCEPNPCQNGGACQNGAFGATCSCPFPFYGTNCELEEIPPDFCDPNPCQNGGVCQNGAFGAICSCPFFFYGTNCELEDLPPTPPDCPTNMVLLAQSDNDIALGQVRCVGFDPRFTIRIRSQASCVRAFGNGAELLVVDSVDIWHIAGNRMLEVEPGGGGNRGARARTAGLQIAAVQGFENAGWESSRYWAYDLNGDLTPDSRYEWHTASGYFWREGLPSANATSFEPATPREVIHEFDQFFVIIGPSGPEIGVFGFADFLDSDPTNPDIGNRVNLCQLALPYLPYFAETRGVE